MFPAKAPTFAPDHSVFQNTERAEQAPKPDLGVIILRWRVGVRVFIARCFNETRAEKTKKNVSKK